MQRAADRYVEVELVEGDLDDATGSGGAAPPPPPLRSALGRVPREVAITAVAAILLGGSGVAVARVGAERALDARLADVPGLTSSLADPLREDWRAAGGGLVATTDDLVVNWDADALAVVGTELDDGSTRYSTPGACQVATTDGALADRYAAAGSTLRVRPGDVLVCVEGGGMRPPGATGAQPASAHVVDPATGRTRHTIAMPAGDMWQVVDGDLVSIGLDAERRVVAGRWSLRTGEQRWAHHGAEPAPEVPAAAGWGWSSTGATIGLDLGTWSVALDLATGAATEAPAGGPASVPPERVGLPDGRWLEYRPSGSGAYRTTVHPADGGRPVTVPGIVPPLAVDDGSVPGAVPALDVDGASADWRLGLVDLATGQQRWTSEVQGGEIGVLGGVVLLADGSRTVALDARTGDVRWESAPGSTPYFAGWEIVTDGRRILVAEGAGADREIAARDVRTGERLWSMAPPVAEGALVPLPDGTVLVVGPGEMVAMRP
ncbi:PQQ-binding-like beta-propeller repeat protein [uncultured Cellulomonas sp.]|uniref:outer membrane protein assembly factor BamB family protein n=1 Tax=uncultured Cellulomonas sp. TaxID=189682 RepID=UPI00261C8112|nr:PQQ-binding-like beta-propeller repeat protein [uncultured Cellulomonas sp.]